jgi:transglutaminase-like putative cysteine protease
MVSACAREAVLKPTEEAPAVLEPWRIETYAAFVRQNMVYLNEAYTTEYEPSEFIVDTDAGARPIQELMDVKFAADLLAGIDNVGPGKTNKIRRYFGYVRSNFNYRADPERWSSVSDILNNGRADCKGLSLLLVSLLTAAGIESYAAVSNGHMWVSAYDGEFWHVLETDTDPQRKKIYSLPGFYKYPLYKIYPDISLKRKPRERPSDG